MNTIPVTLFLPAPLTGCDGTAGGAARSRPGFRPTRSCHSLDLTELVAVTEDEVHVLIEGLEGADEDAAVLQDAPHAVVDVLQHLAALSHRL